MNMSTLGFEYKDGAYWRKTDGSGPYGYYSGVMVPLVAQPAVFISPTGTVLDPANVQQAGNAAAAAGIPLILGEGTFNFTSGGVVFGTGMNLNRRNTSDSYKALEIKGAGIGKTIINVGAGQKAFWWANDTGAIGVKPAIRNLSIIGPGIGSNAIGVQVGGRSSVRFDLLELFEIEDVLIDNVTSCVIVDDVSGVRGKGLFFLRFKYGWEWGYNVDNVRLVDSYFTMDSGFVVGQPCVITSGSNTISNLPAACISELQVGYAVSAPGLFPRESYVGSINVSGNSVTVVNHNGVAVNASGNGSAASFFCGRVFNFGISAAATAGSLYPSSGSTFVSPYGSVLFGLQGRIAASNHYYVDCLINQVEMISDIPGNSHLNIVHTIYTEQSCLLARIGQPSLGTQVSSVVFENCYFGQPQAYVDVPIRVEGIQQQWGITVRGCSTDGAAINYPWVADDTFNYGRPSLTWEQNKGMHTVGAGSVRIGEPNANACWPTINGSFYSNSARKGDSFEIRNSGGNWHWHGQDRILISLAGGSRTLNNPLTYSTDLQGKELIIVVTGQAGNSITLGTYFLRSDGTAFGTVASGATGTRAILNFIWNSDANKFVLQAPIAWVAP